MALRVLGCVFVVTIGVFILRRWMTTLRHRHLAHGAVKFNVDSGNTEALDRFPLEMQVFVGGGGTVCRVFGVCLLGNGRWSLRRSFNTSHVLDVLDQCGMVPERMEFIDEGSSATSGFVPHSIVDVDVVDAVVRKVRILQGDVVNVAGMLDVVERWRQLNGSMTCFGRDQFTSGNCSHLDLSPALFVDEDVLTAKVTDWRRSLIEKFTSGRAPTLTLMSQQQYAEKTPVCFKSLLTTAMASGEVPPRLLQQDSTFSELLGLQRSRRNALPTEMCKLSVRIVQPRHSVQHFNDLTDVLSMITNIVQTLNETAPRLDVQVLHIPSDLDLEEDIEMMQKIDVLITPHWEHNPSILFLREGSAMLEVFQYGLASGPFPELAHSLALEYNSISSMPDRESFIACLNDLVVREPRREELRVVFQRSLEEDTQRFDHTNMSSFATTRIPQLRNSEARQCLEKQHLLLDPHFIYKYLYYHSRRLCQNNATTDTSQKPPTEQILS